VTREQYARSQRLAGDLGDVARQLQQIGPLLTATGLILRDVERLLGEIAPPRAADPDLRLIRSESLFTIGADS
jgi:hypothetical protein